MDVFGPDELRVIEAVAALLVLMPPGPEETSESYAERMANWSILQGPTVRWEAMWTVIYEMYTAYMHGAPRDQLYQIGAKALQAYDNGAWNR
jgi:hypothetical protein